MFKNVENAIKIPKRNEWLEIPLTVGVSGDT